MPYTIRKENDKWCVKKKNPDGSLETMPGGCHESRDKAVNHMQAILVNETKEKNDSD